MSMSADQTKQPPLAIVGLSALFPKAENLDQFWSNIRRGVDAITEVPETHWNPDDYFDSNQKSPDMTYARRGGFLSPVPFDPLEYGISPNNLEAIDTSQLLGLVGARRALEHAGYGAGRKFDRSRVGCILGVTGTLEMVIPLGARLGHPKWRKALKDAGVPDDVADDVVQRISESYVPWQENSFPGLLGNVVAGRIANRLDLHGTNCVVDAACASSLSAIHLAALELWTGRSDMVVTGGIDTFNDIFMFMCFSKTPALSPTGDAKPFSDSADGTILGEGVGILVLKRLADAERDGDRIYAVLKGIGTSSDGAGNAVYAPKAEGQIRCLQDAYRVSGVSPDTIELVEAHGTGTKVGDATEVSGLMQVYKSTGRKGAWCAVGSIKSQIGHTKAAAGAAGVIKAVLALQHRVLPPTIKVGQPPAPMMAEDSPFYVNTEARPWCKPHGYPRRAAISAFGFGGSNFHCVLEESPQQFESPDWDGDVQVVALSAPNAAELGRKLQEWATTADWPALRQRAAASRAAFRPAEAQRLLFVLERDKTDCAKLVAGALTMLDKYADRSQWSTPDGAYYGRGPIVGRLGMLFPGQGSQYVGMLRELSCQFPVMNDVLSEANDVYASCNDASVRTDAKLSDYIYPQPSWNQATRDRRDSELRATQIAQPAIGAISLGALAVLDQFGVYPEAAAGHSYGELTALCASRRFAPKTLYRLSMLRGRLMAEAQEVDGGMLAVGAPLTQVEAAIKEMAVDLVVANYNSPNQVVLSGRIPEIDRATELFSKRNLRGKKLPVAAAFHSPLVSTASRAFRPELEEVEFAPSQLPVYANSTATQYPADPAAARDLLASQLARPVNFVNEIEQMYADGVRTFLEVGPGAVLTGLVNSILSGREYRAIALDSSNGRRGGIFDLAHALAQLSASGYSIRLDAWDPRPAEAAESGSNRLRIPICGANYVKPRTPLPPRAPMALSSAPETQLPMVSRNEMFLGSSAESTVIAQTPADPVVTTSDNLTPNFSQASSMSPFSQSDFGSGLPQSDDSLATIQDHLKTLQRMQEETARIHRQFLESQEAALRTFEELAKRQLELTLRQHQPGSNGSSSRQIAFDAATSYAPSISDLIPAAPANQNEFIGSIVEPVAPQIVVPPPAVPAPVAPTIAVSIPAAPIPVAPAPVAPAAASSPLTAIVLSVVSEKTGYPTEMLNLGMSLDHDLGIDSIKRVEILSALQERVPNLPAFKPEELGSLHTLNDVVALADARTGSPSPAAFTPSPVATQTAVPVPAAVVTPAAASALTATVLAVVSEKTGYPTEMLNLGMSLDHDLGIDSIKRVEILSALQERVTDLPAFKPEELGSLHTLQDVVTLAEARTAGSSAVAALAVVPSSTIPAPAPIATAVAPQTGSALAGPSSGLTETVLAVVSEKTGYPVEMLNLKMSLDHDLGIDSIKRVEILSALQERVPNLPAFKPEELGSLHTLNDVVILADARTVQSTSVAAPPVTQAAVPAAAVAASVIAPPPVVQSTPPQQAVPASNLTATVLSVVSEKTGYPTEMLNLEMSLDHDLGIDSIKRVEILSALQERVPNLPAFLPEELGELHTLKDVVTLAEARTGHLQKPVPAPVAPAPVSMPVSSPVTEPVRSQVVAPPRRQTNPGEPCDQPATLVRSVVRAEALPPVSSAPELPIQRGSEIWVTEDGLELSLRIAAELSARGFKPRVVNLDEPSASAIPERFAGLIIVSPAEGTTDRQLWRAIEWLQKVGPALRRTAANSTAVFSTISRLDGQFGFGPRRTITDPISGGLSGLVKSAAREWPELTCKAFDLATDWPSAGDAAQQIVNELFRKGPIEIGLMPGGRSTPKVVEESLTSMVSGPVAIKPGELIVVSGGARGVTAEAALAVAHQWKSRLVILGRSPLPPEEPEWLKKLSSETEIKQGLIASLPRGTLPKVIESNYRQILASREVTMTLARLREAGVPVSYHAVDIRDHATVRPLLLQLQGEFGPIRGIIHGAGVLADQRIEDKTRDQFERVYQTKVSGLRNLLGAVRPDRLEFLCLFSSYTARYGRVGQCDYAVANEVLNKLACQFAVDHPRTHVVSFNWGPWDGGMVTGGLKKLFAAEQVGLIPLTDGANLVVQELSQATSRPVEVLVLGKNEDLPAASAAPAVGPAPAQPVAVPLATPPAATAPSATVTRQPEPTPAPSVAPATSVRNSSNILLAGASPTPSGSSVAPTRQSVLLQGSSNILLAGEPVPPVRVMTPPPVRQQGSSNVLLAGSIPAPQQPKPVPAPNPSGSWVFAEIGQTGANDANELKVAFERTIDLKQYPFLESHVIGGRAVLPVAVVMEWLAHGAIHHNPGLDLEGIDDFRVFHGVRMDRVGSITLRVMVGKTIRVGGRFTVRTQLVSQSGGRDVVHAGGTVTLTSQYSPAAEPQLKVTLRGYSLDMATAYATKLFHGSHLQGIAAVEACSQDGIIVDSRTSPAPWAWMREPLRSAWIADPLSIDAALQAVILWAQEIKGLPCLPCSITSYRQYRKVFPHTGVKIVVQVTQASEHSIRVDIEFLDLSGMVVATMTGCESIADASLASAFRNNRLAPEGG